MAILRMIRGHDPGRVFELNGGRTVIGRDPDTCDIVLIHNAVSRQHATIEIAGEEAVIEDLTSRNGTLVNGRMLTPGADGRQTLHNSDWIEINGFCLAYEDDPTSDSTVLIESDMTHIASDIGSTVSVSSGSMDPRLRHRAEFKLRAVLRIIEDVAKTVELKDVLPKILDSLLRTFDQAQCASILFRDTPTNEFVPTVVRRRDGKKDAIRVSRTIIDHVLKKRTALLSNDAQHDKRFLESSSVREMHLRSIMCAPLLSGEGEVMGAIQLFSGVAQREFSHDDLDVLAGVSRHIAIVIENARLYDAAMREQRDRLEERFRNLIEGSIQGVLIHRNTKPLYVNEAYASLFGYTADELLKLGETLPLIAPEDRDRLQGYMKARMNGKHAPMRYEYRGLRKDGAKIWLENMVTVVDWGGLPAIQSTVIDISERRRAEQELRHSEAKFRALAETTVAGIFMWAEDKFVSVNTGLEQITGYTREELLQMNFWEVIHPDYREMVHQRGLARIRGEDVPSQYEAKILTKEGQVRWIEITAARTEDDEQTVIGTAFDITERRSIEEAMRKSEATLRTVTDSSPDFVMLLDLDGEIQFINRTRPEHRIDDIVGTTVFDYVPARFHSSMAECFRRVRESKQADLYETEYHGPQQEVFFFETRVAPIIEDDEVVSFVAHATDVTERRKAEAAMRESELRFRQLAGNISEVFFLTDASLNELLYVSPAFEQVWGQSAACLQNRPEAILETIHPDDRTVLADAMRRRAMGETKGDTELEYRIVRPDGCVRWIASRQSPVHDEQGNLVRMAGVARDITKRKEAEEALQKAHDDLERRVQERTAALARSNKDLEQFAYMVSHDLQEPLRSVTGYCQLLKRRYADRLDKEGLEFLNYAVEGAQRMDALIRDLLSFSRIATRGRPLAPTDSREVFAEVTRSLRAAIEDARAEVTQENLGRVLADPTQLGQVFQNLIENALKFRRDGSPRVHVTSRADGHECVFSVSDNGIGIDPAHSDRIFAVFQRLHTRDEYPGTGIGLAVCKKVIERHGGRIWVESEPGRGSTFHFTLPLADGEAK